MVLGAISLHIPVSDSHLKSFRNLERNELQIVNILNIVIYSNIEGAFSGYENFNLKFEKAFDTTKHCQWCEMKYIQILRKC